MSVLETASPLWGQWKVDRPIGSGPHGSVHQVSHVLATDLRRAVRRIPISRPEILEQLTEDMSLCARLRGIDVLLSYDEHLLLSEEGVFSLLLRMEQAESLASQMEARPFAEPEILQLGIDIATAMTILEGNSLPHRNIKPSNIFSAELTRWRLGDLALGCRMGVLDRESAFTAPEVAAGAPPSEAADIYALGIVLFTLCNENLPPVSPPRLPPVNASPTLAQIILKACASEPRNRYANATGLLQALTSLQTPAELPQNAEEPDLPPILPEAEEIPDEPSEPSPQPEAETASEIAVEEAPEPLPEVETVPLPVAPPIAEAPAPIADEVPRRSRKKPLMLAACLCLVVALAVVTVVLLRIDTAPATRPVLAETPADTVEAVTPPAALPEPPPAPAPIAEPVPEPEPPVAEETPPVEAEDPAPAKPEYILPTSNETRLSYEDLWDFTWEQCGLARNEIYARHGCIFPHAGLTAYFESQPWYEGTVPLEEFNVNDHFNDAEMFNVSLIRGYEIDYFGSPFQKFTGANPSFLEESETP